MNIVYYLQSFPVLSQSFILNEVYELEQSGHNVAICALTKPEGDIVHKEFDELQASIRYMDSPSYSDVLELFSRKILHPRILSQLFYRESPTIHAANLLRAKRCIEFVESLPWEPDHVHSHFATTPKFGALLMANYYHVPFTITTHAYDIFQKPVGLSTQRLLQRANRIITISKYNRDYIRTRFSPQAPIDIVRAGIRPEKFSPSGSSVGNRIVTISRFVEKKGLSYALDAVKIAKADIPDLEYHIIGSGELKPDLVQKVNQLGLTENVEFLENVEDHELINELDEARCFLLPCVIAESGNRDGIPVALMEAMAMKTPPISTTVSGIPELIDHKQNGLLTEPRDPKTTAKAIVSLLNGEVDWETYAEQARQKVETEFNIGVEAEKLESSFRSAMTSG